MLFSCEKETTSLAVEKTTSTEERLSNVKLPSSDDFSLYLNSLSIEKRDSALLNYATNKRNVIIALNNENEKKRIGRINQEPSSFKKVSSPNQSLSELNPGADIIGCTPLFDIDQSQSVVWTIVKNFFDLWRVDGTETVTINSKGNITDLTHNGSMLAGATFSVSWSEGVVQTHFTPRVGLVDVAGTITVAMLSFQKNGLLTLNCPAPL